MSKQELDAQRIVAEVKALLGPPALFSSEKEEDYYKIMLALAKSFKPVDAFGQIQLSDMTFAEMRKNWHRRQQSLAMERSIQHHRAAQTRRAQVQAQKNDGKASDAADLAELKDETPEFRRQFQLIVAVDGAVAKGDALLENAVQEANDTHAIKAGLHLYGVLDQFISTDINRRNESAEWLAWSREFTASRANEDPEGERKRSLEQVHEETGNAEPSLVPGKVP